MPREGRTRSLRLASVPLLAGLASASMCLCILACRARADPLIAAAGDIACDTSSAFFNDGVGTADRCRQKYTSDLLVQVSPTAVLTLGDNQYHVGSLSDFNASFDPTWGRLKPIIHPAIGNHEYGTAGARGYFDYFNGPGNQSGPAGERDKGYYSFDIGSWHLIALNSECERIDRGAAANGCAEGSPQESSLRSDLAAHPSSCTLAYWHRPRFNSGFRGNHPETQAFWQALHEAGADIVLSGDAHDYERFAPQDASGNLDLDGHPPIRRRHRRRILHDLEQREAQQRGASEHHLRGPRAHPSPNQLRVAVSSRGRPDVHRLRRRSLSRPTTRSRRAQASSEGARPESLHYPRNRPQRPSGRNNEEGRHLRPGRQRHDPGARRKRRRPWRRRPGSPLRRPRKRSPPWQLRERPVPRPQWSRSDGRRPRKRSALRGSRQRLDLRP